MEEPFNITDFPVIEAFHAFDPRNIPKDLPSGYGEREIDLIYDFYGSNKINIFQGQRNKATAINVVKKILQTKLSTIFA